MEKLSLDQIFESTRHQGIGGQLEREFALRDIDSRIMGAFIVKKDVINLVTQSTAVLLTKNDVTKNLSLYLHGEKAVNPFDGSEKDFTRGKLLTEGWIVLEDSFGKGATRDVKGNEYETYSVASGIGLLPAGNLCAYTKTYSGKLFDSIIELNSSKIVKFPESETSNITIPDVPDYEVMAMRADLELDAEIPIFTSHWEVYKRLELLQENLNRLIINNL